MTTVVSDSVSLGIENCRTSSIDFTLVLHLKGEKININYFRVYGMTNVTHFDFL